MVTLFKIYFVWLTPTMASGLKTYIANCSTNMRDDLRTKSNFVTISSINYLSVWNKHKKFNPLEMKKYVVQVKKLLDGHC